MQMAPLFSLDTKWNPKLQKEQGIGEESLDILSTKSKDELIELVKEENSSKHYNYNVAIWYRFVLQLIFWFSAVIFLPAQVDMPVIVQFIYILLLTGLIMMTYVHEYRCTNCNKIVSKHYNNCPKCNMRTDYLLLNRTLKIKIKPWIIWLSVSTAIWVIVQILNSLGVLSFKDYGL